MLQAVGKWCHFLDSIFVHRRNSDISGYLYHGIPAETHDVLDARACMESRTMGQELIIVVLFVQQQINSIRDVHRHDMTNFY